MSRLLQICGAVSLTALAACAQPPAERDGSPGRSGPAATMQEMAELYLYRAEPALAQAGGSSLFINGQLVARLQDHQYTTLRVSPGCYELMHSFPELQSNQVQPMVSTVCVDKGSSSYLSMVSTPALQQDRLSSLISEVHPVSRDQAYSGNSITQCSYHRPAVAILSNQPHGMQPQNRAPRRDQRMPQERLSKSHADSVTTLWI